MYNTSTMRPDGRKPGDLRTITITPDTNRYAEGSVLIGFGETQVICTASVEEKVPPFLEGQGKGWVTAEYAMLPRATHTRSGRNGGGRGQEIQRLIGRSLRAALNLRALGPRQITVDCDVIQADGGTRTAAITGAAVALQMAMNALVKAGTLKASPMKQLVAATSVGIVEGTALLDLAYEEDSQAEVDMNVVMTGSGDFVEIQATAEGRPFTGGEMQNLLALAATGIRRLNEEQRAVLPARFLSGAR